MRKLVLVLTLVLAGCAGSLPSISNPVTPQMLYDLELAGSAAFAGLNAYKKSCVQKLIPQSCRATIVVIQSYTRQIPLYMAQLRDFVAKDDQVNAITLYNRVNGLLAQVKETKGGA